MFKENQTTTDSKTVIGASVNVEGDFKGQGDVIVEGKLKGSLATEHDVNIGAQAEIKASIKANNVYVAGNVTGDIEANGHIELSQSAQINGNITATTITIESGAIFNGQCTTRGSELKNEETEELKEE